MKILHFREINSILFQGLDAPKDGHLMGDIAASMLMGRDHLRRAGLFEAFLERQIVQVIGNPIEGPEPDCSPASGSDLEAI